MTQTKTDSAPSPFSRQEDRPEPLTPASEEPPQPGDAEQGLTLWAVQRAHVLAVVERLSGDLEKSSEVLGISPDALAERLRDYGVGGGN
jgi:DNA-binding NtrC family response regulator